ncbi:hypothetical protein K437DRAFT_3459 [Tilletiaria anomala UBC 951]|uniref:RlpA-like protein double-psi beta-barrel domain-containing protein n=1 Tax=Tilletiaria anomala (strain ATCC 24038 / CBS 436.72 / UBC 951) TaxID=1037660 RepID=A0A066WLY7_TILAU|nr:uncharacterized protein K437DRAFT_3459 [Tilletiaria anomala UBC 951]KDN53613.1 hypothetical protein K437DRAFT_3459 [Tilletiaria anomala UBC 951]
MKITAALTLLAVSISLSEASLSSSKHASPAQGLDAARRHHAKLAERASMSAVKNVTDVAGMLQLFKRGGECSGHGTWYNTETGNAGACGSMLSNNAYTVALAQPAWGNLNQRFSGCNSVITITANGKSHTARIVDACPTGGGNCGSACDLDMSPALFDFFAPQSVGKMPISWTYGGDVVKNVVHAISGNDGNRKESTSSSSSDDAASRASAAASRASASAAASRSSLLASKSRASASAAASRSSVSAAASRLSVLASKSRASVAKSKSESEASASRSAAAAAESYRKADKNIMYLNNILDAYGKMAQQAH